MTCIAISASAMCLWKFRAQHFLLSRGQEIEQAVAGASSDAVITAQLFLVPAARS